jgi:hypothetical protein
MANRRNGSVKLIKTKTDAGPAGSRPTPPTAVAQRASLCAGHVQQSGGESPLCNLMEVKHE